MKELLVVGVGGQKQNGKDTLADYLALKLKHRRITDPSRYDGSPTSKGSVLMHWGRGSFAGAVKRIFCETFGFDPKDIDAWKVLPTPPPGFQKPVREALTFIGDGFRSIMSNVWIETAFRGEGWQHKVYSDIRYVNEARKIRDLGGFNILIHRKGGLNFDENRSEAELRPYIQWCLDKGREGIISEWPEFQEAMALVADEDLPGCVGHHMAPHHWYTLAEVNRGEVPTLRTFLNNLSQFDAFILNDGTMDDLYRKIDDSLIPTLGKNFKLED